MTLRQSATAIFAGFALLALAAMAMRWHGLQDGALSDSLRLASPASAANGYKPPAGRKPNTPSAQSRKNSTKRGISPDKKTQPADSPKAIEPPAADDSPPAYNSINLNTANAEELQRLPGIGPVLAGRIVAWRHQHGGFRSVAQLDEVKGIGAKKLADIEPYVFIH